MASLSRAIMNDIHALRVKYHADENYEAAGMMDLAEDHTDGISKHHLPYDQYMNRLVEIFESVKAMDFTTENQSSALDEAISVVRKYQKQYEESVNTNS